MTLADEIKRYGLNLGYSRVGITSADDFTEYAEELRGRGDAYAFFLKGARDPLKGASPRSVVPFARSIVVLAWDYAKTAFPRELVGKVGRVYQARTYNPPPHYAGAVLFESMRRFLEEKGMRVSTEALLPDRWAAARAGVATFGKNNFAYVDGIGSFVTIRTMIVDAELPPDAPTVVSKCPADCTRCLDSCPSGALHAPFKLDPRLCLAFNAWKTVKDPGLGLTDSIPRHLRSCMGQQVHGCDLCQEACPRNRARLEARLPDDAFLANLAAGFSLTGLLHLDDEFYETRVRPIMYNYIKDRKFFQRNAAVAIGNTGDPSYLPELEKELAHPDEAVREHVAWAIGKIGGAAAREMLERRRERETSALVLEEIGLALEG